MNNIIDKIVNSLVSVLKRRNMVNHRIEAFLDRGKNKRNVLLVLLFIPFFLFSYFLYQNYQNLYLAPIPLLIYGLLILIASIFIKLKPHLQNERFNSKDELTGIHFDFNELVFKKIYNYLVKYEYLDENLTSYKDFSNVMRLDFKEHDSVLHFNMNQAELKHILDNLKKLKKGISLRTFEKSNMVYNKGKLVTQKSLTSAFSDNRPDKEFLDHVDDFFEFLTDI